MRTNYNQNFISQGVLSVSTKSNRRIWALLPLQEGLFNSPKVEPGIPGNVGLTSKYHPQALCGRKESPTNVAKIIDFSFAGCDAADW
ncbi:hypothetical protein Pla144_36880 [Bythopirellula polymerisocia]|uniref:Uncharacterized protein n=1 Tax=Bythopirellula polymerisocia TaxID=2528003 RepID=A0A5C6CF48_9BACT|nr:hypothetical protein Pla144_36880 [Bythopirellula polymerisocia]